MEGIAKELRTLVEPLESIAKQVIDLPHSPERPEMYRLLWNMAKQLARLLQIATPQEATHATIARSRETSG